MGDRLGGVVVVPGAASAARAAKQTSEILAASRCILSHTDYSATGVAPARRATMAVEGGWVPLLPGVFSGAAALCSLIGSFIAHRPSPIAVIVHPSIAGGAL